VKRDGEVGGAPEAQRKQRVRAPFRRLLPLGGEASRAQGADDVLGAKAARLGRACAAGLPVLPGWVVPVAEAIPALDAGAAAVRAGRPAAARRAVLGRPLDDGLARELREAAIRLGGRVIVRSSSPLERDGRWSGAFSSVSEVGPDDIATAVRSCWASAFAVDPLERLALCGLPLEALRLGVLLQPEIRMAAGGVARVTAGGDSTVIVEGIPGHPGPLLSGWADGASARVPLPFSPAGPPSIRDMNPVVPPEGGLQDLIGRGTVAAVARLAAGCYGELGDDTIEWASCDGETWLLQAQRSAPDGADGETRRGPAPRPAVAAGPAARGAPEALRLLAAAGPAGPGHTAQVTAALRAADAHNGQPGSREWMPLLAAVVLAQGRRVPARPAVAGTAAGRLVACRPHERPPGDCRDAILLVDRPLPSLAPLLFAARGVMARAGAAGSHLAEVARSLGVPMVIGCQPEPVTGPCVADRDWIAAIDGSTGEAALLAG
jgi:phosphohistidine swiveling domain-containing protein